MGRSLSVLLVEDEPMIALMVSEMLEAEGFMVAGLFQHNVQALAYLRDHRPDVAILDFSLADGKAEPVARRLNELAAPFCVISGFTKSAADPLFDGVEWLDKPFSQEQLGHAVRACLSNSAKLPAYV